MHACMHAGMQVGRYVCMYVSRRIYVCICEYVFTHAYMCNMYRDTHICIYMNIYIYIYAFICVSTFFLLHVCNICLAQGTQHSAQALLNWSLQARVKTKGPRKYRCFGLQEELPTTHA